MKQQKNRFWIRHKSTVIISLITVCTALLFHRPIIGLLKNIFYVPKTEPVTREQAWLTIFVHGSFGSLLGFISPGDVLSDKISGTAYRKINKGMRDDPHYFQYQPILQRGLIRVQPTFNIEATAHKKYVAFPLIRAYDIIQETMNPHSEKNYYYTFGWSGLISQNSRRFEAIRLYNALGQELEKFHHTGIKPKIRLIAHSHGGNVCLNLAAINMILSKGIWDQSKQLSPDPDTNDSLKKMLTVMQDLTTKEVAKTKLDQKVYDYVPVVKNITIDELIMYGTPIQPETEAFCYANTFKKVYNFYSGQDFVQRLDWVSSKQLLSTQRLSRTPLKKDDLPRVVQAKIMTERPPSPIAPEQKIADQKPQAEPSVMDEVMAGRNIFVRTSKDPTHQELWFILWQLDEPDFASFLYPLPIVVLTPLLTHALDKTDSLHDVSVLIHPTSKNIYVDVINPNNTVEPIKHSVKISRNIIIEIQKKIGAWKPENLSRTSEFEAAYKHLTLNHNHLDLCMAL